MSSLGVGGQKEAFEKIKTYLATPLALKARIHEKLFWLVFLCNESGEK
jgi:hypothetical protein